MSSPRTQRHPWLALTLLLLLVMGGGTGALAQEKDAAKKEGKGKAKEAKAADAGEEDGAAKPTAATPAPTTGLFAFGKMLPVGQEHKELEIPSFKNGAPASKVQAKSLTRTDDENMFLERMVISMYGPPGEAEKDMIVQLRTANFHMPSSIIASDERSRISRSDFDLQGDTLIFDTATGQGKMVGNVRMILHDASAFTKSAAEASEEKAKEQKEPRSQRGAATQDAAPATTSPTASGQPATTATTPAEAPARKPGSGKASPTNPKK